jgi:hypothetical protein
MCGSLVGDAANDAFAALLRNLCMGRKLTLFAHVSALAQNATLGACGAVA